jgi:predicted secreted Zn-dependent protease
MLSSSIILLVASACYNPDLSNIGSPSETLDPLDGLIDPVDPVAAQFIKHDITERLYVVTGQTGAELRNSVIELGPKDPNSGKTMSAVTSSYFVPELNSDSCDLQRLTINTEIILPHYSGSQTPDSESFTNLIALIKLHELQHVELARRYGALIVKEINSELDELKNMTFNSCDDQNRVVGSVTDRIFESFRFDNVELDARTQHGRDVGACWDCVGWQDE